MPISDETMEIVEQYLKEGREAMAVRAVMDEVTWLSLSDARVLVADMKELIEAD